MTAKCWKVQGSKGLYEYLSNGEAAAIGERSGLSGYYTRARGEAWGLGAERMVFERGRYKGKNLAEVGLSRYTFDNLADGKSACGTEELIPRRNGRHVPGFDFQFSPDKSVSVEAAFNPEMRAGILREHQLALKAAFDVIQSNALVCSVPKATPAEVGERLCRAGLRKGEPSRKQGSETEPQKGELIAYVATHWTSRPTAETQERLSGADPQLHSHCFIFNEAWCAGKWRAIDHRRLVHTVAYAEATYQATLADGLQKMGYALDTFEDAKGNRTFRLKGADEEVNAFFSTRHRELREKERAFEHGYGRAPKDAEMKDLVSQFNELHQRRPSAEEREALVFAFEHGHARPPTEKERQAIIRSGRLPKTGQETEPDWASQREALERHNLSVPTPVRTDKPEEKAPLEEREAEVLAEVLSPKGLHRGDAVFERHQVRPAILRASIGRLEVAEAEALATRFESSDELRLVQTWAADHARDRLTTRTNLAKEAYVVSEVAKAASEKAPSPKEQFVEAAIAATERRLRERDPQAALAEEQKEAIRYLARPVRWASMEGWAGTGKTFCTRPFIDAYRRSGLVDQVIMVSVAGRTALSSGTKVGTDSSATIERLAKQVEEGKLRLGPRSLVIVDEAAMLDTDRAAKLVKVVKDSGCMVRTIGDPSQAEAIGSGGWYQQADKAIGHVTLSDVRRQLNPQDRQVCKDVREHRAAAALDNLERRGRFHVSETHSDRVAGLLSDYRRFADGGDGAKDLLVVTDTSNVEIDRLNRLIQDIWVERHKVRGPGVEATDKKADRTESFHLGDRVVFTKNWQRLGQKEVLNGSGGEVIKVDPAHRLVSVLLEDPDRTGNRPVVSVHLPVVERDQPLRLAYAGYVNSQQGAEGRVVLALPGLDNTNHHTGYSMLTRGVEEIHVYAARQVHGADPKAALAEAWTKAADKRTALSQLPAPQQLEVTQAVEQATQRPKRGFIVAKQKQPVPPAEQQVAGEPERKERDREERTYKALKPFLAAQPAGDRFVYHQPAGEQRAEGQEETAQPSTDRFVYEPPVLRQPAEGQEKERDREERTYKALKPFLAAQPSTDRFVYHPPAGEQRAEGQEQEKEKVPQPATDRFVYEPPVLRQPAEGQEQEKEHGEAELGPRQGPEPAAERFSYWKAGRERLEREKREREREPDRERHEEERGRSISRERERSLSLEISEQQ